MMKLYGMSDSGNCYKPRLLLAKLGRPFEHVEVSSHVGATRSADYVAKNPNAMVPLLELDDGRLLAESNAMLLYFGEGTRFVPDDDYQRALAYQWLFFEQYSHEPYIAVRRALLTFPSRARDATPERLAQTFERGEKALGVMEKHLADIALLCRRGDQRRRPFALRLYACRGRGRLRSRPISGGRRLACAGSRAIRATSPMDWLP